MNASAIANHKESSITRDREGSAKTIMPPYLSLQTMVQA